MKLLAVSDQVIDFLHTPEIAIHYPDIDLILSCGDLPLDYLEFIANTLDAPLYFVWGNHDTDNDGCIPPNCFCLDGDAVALSFGAGKSNVTPFTLLLAGLGGSIRYKPTGKNQFTQKEMFLRALELVPRFLYNHKRFGRFLDILITHSPPLHIHDQQDPAHIGLKALVPILDLFEPRYHLHGHTTAHGYDQSGRTLQYRNTQVINVNPYRVIEFTCGEA